MTNTIPNVLRELLERCAQYTPTLEKQEDRARALSELRALLSTPSPAGVDGLEVVAWRIGFPNNAGYKVYEQRQPWAYEQCGVPSVIVYEVQELCRLSDAQAIIDGLRGLVERSKQFAAGHVLTNGRISASLHAVEAERDQHARRIGELEGLLRRTFMFAVKVQPISRRLFNDIDAALSAGKEGK